MTRSSVVAANFQAGQQLRSNQEQTEKPTTCIVKGSAGRRFVRVWHHQISRPAV
jgi:hypothetical protein